MSKLFLIPNAISEDVKIEFPIKTFGNDNSGAVASLRLFFVEEPKSARRLLKQLNPDFPLQECRFLNLNEHTKPAEIKEYAGMIQKEDAGIISESGCPCVADPGADLVLLAHKNNVEIIPLIGPSSIIMALMASGLGGQSFAFNGYLPKERNERAAKIKMLEARAINEGQTQIFMDAPYRNQNVMDDVLVHANPKTLLCVAVDITGKEQFIKTKTIEDWRKANIQLPRLPALFIMHK